MALEMTGRESPRYVAPARPFFLALRYVVHVGSCMDVFFAMFPAAAVLSLAVVLLTDCRFEGSRVISSQRARRASTTWNRLHAAVS